MGFKPRPRVASEVTDIIAELGAIKSRGSNSNLGEAVTALLAAPPAEQGKRWHWIEILLEDGQGGIYPAAGRAAPLLLALAGHRSTPLRERIFPFLIFLALAYQKNWLESGCHRGQGWAHKWFATERRSHVIYRRLRSGLDVFIAALADPDPAVRTAAAYALAWFGEDAERVRAALLPVLAGEDDARVRASLLLCLGLQGKYLASAADAALLAAHLDDAEVRVRIAAAHALLYLPGDHLSDRLFAEIARAPQIPLWADFPWWDSSGTGVDFTRVRLLSLAASRRDQVVAALFEHMAATSVEPPPKRRPAPVRLCYWAARELGGLLFPNGFASDPSPSGGRVGMGGREHSLPRVDASLSPEQRRYIDMISADPAPYAGLFPARVYDEMRALVGLPALVPASILDDDLVIAAETRTIRQWWKQHTESGEPAALAATLVEQLSADQVVGALVDGGGRDHAVPIHVAALAHDELPANWAPGFPLLAGGEVEASTVGGIVTIGYATGEETFANYRTAARAAAWRVGDEYFSPFTAVWGKFTALRDRHEVRVHFTRNGSFRFHFARSWRLNPALGAAATDHFGAAFLTALTERARAIAAAGMPGKDNPNPGSAVILAAATDASAALGLAVDDPAFATLARYAHAQTPRDFRHPDVARYLERLPEGEREALVLALFDLDSNSVNAAGYARECPTPAVLAAVMARARKRCLAYHLAAVGAPLVAHLLAAATRADDPRRVVFANALSMVRPCPAAALLALLDDADKQVRECGVRGLAVASLAEIAAPVRALLADKKKPRRELGARLLAQLSPAPERAQIAAEALASEKTEAVRKVLGLIAT